MSVICKHFWLHRHSRFGIHTCKSLQQNEGTFQYVLYCVVTLKIVSRTKANVLRPSNSFRSTQLNIPKKLTDNLNNQLSNFEPEYSKGRQGEIPYHNFKKTALYSYMKWRYSHIVGQNLHTVNWRKQCQATPST